MYNLKIDPSICEKCTTMDCIMRCQYIDMTMEEAKEEHSRLIAGEKSAILTDCVTCYACEEYCPYSNHPFYLIVEQQEKHGIYPVPRTITESQIKALSPKGRIKEAPLKGKVIDMCTFPMLAGSIRGKLFENVSLFMGSDVFCNLMYLHFGTVSLIKERVPLVIDNIMKFYLEPNNINEFICFHDECYGTFTKWAPAFGIDVPFKPVHFFEYIYNRLSELKTETKPLKIKAAYQRNCSARLVPETEHFVNKIFDLIGVERAEREYDNENALCCGAVLEAQQRFELAEETQNKNVDDIKASGATHCVFNCPMCYFTLMGKLQKKGIAPILMADLCHQSLAE